MVDLVFGSDLFIRSNIVIKGKEFKDVENLELIALNSYGGILIFFNDHLYDRRFPRFDNNLSKSFDFKSFVRDFTNRDGQESLFNFIRKFNQTLVTASLKKHCCFWGPYHRPICRLPSDWHFTGGSNFSSTT